MQSSPDVSQQTALAASRAKSLATVQTVFAVIVLVCSLSGLIIHRFGDELSVPFAVRAPLAMAFLITAAVDLVIMLGCRAWLTRG
jgi:hypothetical protein